MRQVGQKSINPALLIDAIDKQREIVRAAQAKTRKMRRGQQAAHRVVGVGADVGAVVDPLNGAIVGEPKSDVDWNKPAEPFDGEVWHGRRR